MLAAEPADLRLSFSDAAKLLQMLRFIFSAMRLMWTEEGREEEAQGGEEENIKGGAPRPEDTALLSVETRDDPSDSSPPFSKGETCIKRGGRRYVHQVKKRWRKGASPY